MIMILISMMKIIIILVSMMKIKIILIDINDDNNNHIDNINDDENDKKRLT